ncbi:hypothetical protein DPMN_194287 [Dreissena polymorpha]|uniref:Uncharacterized protein n=1 Tax=Dreissena polymorpha TaxID=45954 RepID=A0A9D3Y3F1_DREPO|nr:hypothetical protein DPMN_194287 [Dreissena polymorpha]
MWWTAYSQYRYMSLWKAHVVDSLQPKQVNESMKTRVVDSLQQIQVYESMEGTSGGQLAANIVK